MEYLRAPDETLLGIKMAFLSVTSDDGLANDIALLKQRSAESSRL